MSFRSSTTKRILKEASDLAHNPTPDFHAAPLDTNLHEWHFTLRGPPAPSPYASGLYHGRIVLPPSYPLRPPSFRFLTPSGRFEVNREICLSISGFHEETWQPAWGVRTALVAIRSFMDAEAGGAVGAMSADEGVRRRLAGVSGGWRCGTCGARTNGEVMAENERLCAEVGVEGREQEMVPEELRLGYREDIEGGGGGEGGASSSTATEEKPVVQSEMQGIPSAVGTQQLEAAAAASPQAATATTTTTPTRTWVAPQQTQHTQVVDAGLAQLAPQRPQRVDTPWLDGAIMGVAGMLVLMIVRFIFL